MTTYTTKEISEHTDLPIPTLRYYEQIGLLDPVERADNGHRRYTERDVLRIEFLKRVRATGMSIREMQYYVDLFRQGDHTLNERLDILQVHRQAIMAQMATLEETVAFLDMKIDRYQEQVTAIEPSKAETVS
ncbi:MAG: MerR family transcriptional regulator [Phototrophicaceae bacterium]